ncbi:MAG: hypothetical protein PHV68_10590, partial [Candidatus Gastranaerophilales bacterium]|nr:hypothetical protein [Candidatus Gastranaerophilales bacterium]
TIPTTDITCNENVNGKTFEDLSDVPLEKCSDGSSPPFLYNPNQDSLEKTWRCGEETCKLFLERKPEETQSDQFYADSDKGCDLGKEFETIIYKDKATNQQVGNAQKIYCPAALPFFTIRNVVAVVILIGLVYIIFALRNQNKKSSKKKKRR